jgi:VanZ like protein
MQTVTNIKNLIYKNVRLFAFLWAAVIFILCATPGQYIPSADWLELLSFDKFVHATMFFTLSALLFAIAVKYGQSKTIIALYFLIAVLYGGSLEVMQAKIFSNRSADWKDMFANTFGCVVALLFLKKIRASFISH